MICDWQSEDEEKARLATFLTQCRLGVLGTIGADLAPQGALVGVAFTPEFEVVFDTVRSSRKYGNLVARPGCSFVFGWEGEQTVQYEGDAREVTAAELERYHKIYFAAWPECVAHTSWPGIAYFAVRPRWIRTSDFGQNPPLIREFRFGE
jgi:pyridoxine/pyridoxamine 5'-phosphate oxidase